MSQRFYIIDAHATIHRAYHAIRGLANPDGHPTGAVFGFAKILLAMMRDHRPDLVAVSADSRGKVFRHEMYAEYKANRPPMPDDLAWQIPKVEAVCAGYGIPVYKVPGYEADDIIGTLAGQAAEAGFEVVVVSDDKDVLQLVGENVKAFAPSKDNKQGRDDPCNYVYRGKEIEQVNQSKYHGQSEAQDRYAEQGAAAGPERFPLNLARHARGVA